MFLYLSWSSFVSSLNTGGMNWERRRSSAMMALPRLTSFKIVWPQLFSGERKSWDMVRRVETFWKLSLRSYLAQNWREKRRWRGASASAYRLWRWRRRSFGLGISPLCMHSDRHVTMSWDLEFGAGIGNWTKQWISTIDTQVHKQQNYAYIEDRHDYEFQRPIVVSWTGPSCVWHVQLHSMCDKWIWLRSAQYCCEWLMTSAS